MKTFFGRVQLSAAVLLLATIHPFGLARGQSMPPLAVGWYYPADHEVFGAGTSLYVHAWVTDSRPIQTLEYYANGHSIGLVTNKSNVLVTSTNHGNPFFIAWSNVAAGAYVLTAVAKDSHGSVTSAPISITVTNPVPHPEVSISAPGNGATFHAPIDITLAARAVETHGAIAKVEFFANTVSLGTVLSASSSATPLYQLIWSNAPAGTYALKAVATDTNGLATTSAVVNIGIITPPPPPPIPFTVQLWTSGSSPMLFAPANIQFLAKVTDSNALTTVQFIANSNTLDTRTNASGLPPDPTSGSVYFFNWSNVVAGTYTVTAVALDSVGHSVTSAPVHFTVNPVMHPPPPPPVPFLVSLVSPLTGQSFLAPANLAVRAVTVDSNIIRTVEFFANGASIGLTTNSGGGMMTNSTQANPFAVGWSNVLAGNYTLLAIARDSAGLSATSAPVSISVVTSRPPVITLFAPDPVAVEGTNYPAWTNPHGPATNYISGTNTATFLVHREGSTNDPITVSFSIGGTATNGIDYLQIPDSLTIPAGKTYGLITIVPLDDLDSTNRPYDTVVFSLLAPVTASNAPATYTLGTPHKAAAVILEPSFHGTSPRDIHQLLDSSRFISLPATNGMNYCLQISTNMVTWQSICTNTVVKGFAQFVDPPGMNTAPGVFYRILPVDVPGSY